MERKIELPRSLRAAALTPGSFSEDENSVEVVWTTGATVRRNSWFDGPYDEELIVSPESVRLDRLNGGAPLLNTHASYDLCDVIGVVVPGSARLENGQGLARVQLSDAPGDADIVAKLRSGVIRNISVGYAIHRVEKVDGPDLAVPVWRVVDWEPMEISAVPVPADPGCQTRAGARPDLFPALMVDRAADLRLSRSRLARAQRQALI